MMRTRSYTAKWHCVTPDERQPLLQPTKAEQRRNENEQYSSLGLFTCKIRWNIDVAVLPWKIVCVKKQKRQRERNALCKRLIIVFLLHLLCSLMVGPQQQLKDRHYPSLITTNECEQQTVTCQHIGSFTVTPRTHFSIHTYSIQLVKSRWLVFMTFMFLHSLVVAETAPRVFVYTPTSNYLIK